MLMQWIFVLSPISALTINVATQVIVVHFSRHIGLSILIGLIAGIIIDLFLFFKYIAIFTLSDICINLLVYLTLSFCFFAFLNLNISSLRIRILRECLTRQSEGISMEQLSHIYSPEELLERRLARLEKLGQITQKNDKWILCSHKLLIFTYVIKVLRKIIIA